MTNVPFFCSYQPVPAQFMQHHRCYNFRAWNPSLYASHSLMIKFSSMDNPQNKRWRITFFQQSPVTVVHVATTTCFNLWGVLREQELSYYCMVLWATCPWWDKPRPKVEQSCSHLRLSLPPSRPRKALCFFGTCCVCVPIYSLHPEHFTQFCLIATNSVVRHALSSHWEKSQKYITFYEGSRCDVFVTGLFISS